MQPSLYHSFHTLESTNILAKKMAEQGAEHGTVIHAEQQTGGRGRGGRAFVSPIGGLYFSLILRINVELMALPLTTLAAGVGLCKGIKKATNLHVQLKWPNDLYFEGKKIAGILTESGPVRRGVVDFIVVGVGLNVMTKMEAFSPELQAKVSSLAEVSGRAFSLTALLPTLIQELLAMVQKNSQENKGDLLAEWRHLDYLRGKLLDYVWQDNIIPATGVGLADDGRYVIVDCSGVEHRITVGDLNPIKPVC